VAKTRTKPQSAAIYARISKADKDPLTGELKTLKIEDQVERCRDWAQANGWTLATFIPDTGEVVARRRNGKGPTPEPPKPDTPAVYADNDVSATKQRPRPMYERMLSDVREGRIDGIITVDSDRLTRSSREILDIIDLNKTHGVEIGQLSGHQDLATPPGRFMAKQMAILAEMEIEQKIERQKRQNEARAHRGIAYGGMTGDTRPFGWQDGGQVLNKPEADQVADAVDRLLTGTHFRTVVKEWNETGLPTARGGAWTLTSARQVLIRWRNASIVHRHGVPVAKGTWEPILKTPDGKPDTDKLAAIIEYFDARKNGNAQRTARTYLLSNLALCGACGSTLRHGIANIKDKNPQDTYRCNNHGGGGSCGLNINRAILDEAVIDHIVSALALPDSAVLTQTGDELAEIKKLRERKADLESEADEIRSNKALRPSWKADLLADLEDQIKPLDADLARLRGRENLSSLLLDLTPWARVESGKIKVSFDQSKREDEIRARFDALGGDDIGPKRAVVQAVCESIVVMPHPTGVKPTAESARQRIVIIGVGEDDQESALP
jgi:DNA invertase Pin-like site-specific DNA recombinase